MRCILRIRSGSKRKRTSILFLLACLFLIPGCVRDEPLPGFLSMARAVSVQRTSFTQGPEDVGLLRARRSQGIISEFGGRIVKMHPEGEAIAAGDPVVWLDDKELTQNIIEEEINVKRRRARLNREIESLKETESAFAQTKKETKANWEYNTLMRKQAEVELGRLEDRFERRLIPENEVILARETLDSRLLQENSSQLRAEKSELEFVSNREMIQRSIAIAEAEFEQSQSRIEDLRRILEKAVLKAPIDGIVVYGTNWFKQKFKVGDQIWEGIQVCEIPDLSEMEVVSQVDEADYRYVEVGQAAIVRVSALKDLEIEARVERIASLAVSRNQSRGTLFNTGTDLTSGKVFEILLSLKQTDERLRHGMGVTVNIVRQTIEDALVIPSAAVFRDAGEEFVYVRHRDTFRRRWISSGARSPSRVVVTKGLSESDAVAVLDSSAGAASGAQS